MRENIPGLKSLRENSVLQGHGCSRAVNDAEFSYALIKDALRG